MEIKVCNHSIISLPFPHNIFNQFQSNLRYRWKFAWINPQNHLCSSTCFLLDLFFILFFFLPGNHPIVSSCSFMLWLLVEGISGWLWTQIHLQWQHINLCPVSLKKTREKTPYSDLTKVKSSRCPRANTVSLNTAASPSLCKAERASQKTLKSALLSPPPCCSVSLMFIFFTKSFLPKEQVQPTTKHVTEALSFRNFCNPAALHVLHHAEQHMCMHPEKISPKPTENWKLLFSSLCIPQATERATFCITYL